MSLDNLCYECYGWGWGKGYQKSKYIHRLFSHNVHASIKATTRGSNLSTSKDNVPPVLILCITIQ